MNRRQKQRLIEEMRDEEYRYAFADSMLDTVIAAQIKANRERRDLSQAALGRLAGMKQSFISTVEDVNYGSWTLSTLKRLARAFDLRLVVRFESWGTLFDGIHTRGELDRFDADLLIRPCFENDPALSGITAPLHERGTIVVRDVAEDDYLIRPKSLGDSQEEVIALRSGAGGA